MIYFFFFFLDHYGYFYLFLVFLETSIFLAVAYWTERAVRLVLMLVEVLVTDPTDGRGNWS